MLKLIDGRDELWQWDTGRVLEVDEEITQVHFSNRIYGRSIDVNVKNQKATIPDVLLQVDKPLNVWAFVGTPEDGYTKISKVFNVNKKNKPADYVFTPSEQITIADLEQRLEIVEDAQKPEAFKQLIEEYLVQNPVVKDYSQNNPDAADYIKNRPFWSEIIEAHDVLPKTILTESDGSSYTIVDKFSLTEGDEYKVTWNSVEYKCAAKTYVESNHKVLYLGNLFHGDPDLFEDTGEPFGIVITPASFIEHYGFYAMVYPWDGSVNPTITISAGRKEIVHKLKNKFLSLDWLPTYYAEEQLAAEKIVTNGMGIPTDTKNGFPDMTMKDVAHGDKLAVYLDGERYECEVIVSKNDDSDDDVIAGNIGFIYGEPGVPFCLTFGNSRTSIMCADGEHVASVYKLVPNKIPEYFLPDDLIDDEMLAQAVEEYLKENPIDSGATDAEVAQINQNKEDIESLKLNKLDSSELPEAIDTALAEAKASGEFDGADGKDGEPGPQGEKGEKGDKGDKGDDGDTPVKGTDYFTEADKQEIAEQAAGLVDIPTALPNPKALILTGAVNATYDGSEAVSVEIPSGGEKWETMAYTILTENVESVQFTLEAPCKKVVFACFPKVAVTGWKRLSINGGGDIPVHNMELGSTNALVFEIDTTDITPAEKSSNGVPFFNARIRITEDSWIYPQNGVLDKYDGRQWLQVSADDTWGVDAYWKAASPIINSIGLKGPGMCVTGALFQVWGVRA